MNYTYIVTCLFQVGDSIPSVDLFEDLPTNKVNLAELSKGKKIIVFAVPGAFTPGCSKVRKTRILEIPLKYFCPLKVKHFITLFIVIMQICVSMLMKYSNNFCIIV